MEIKCNYCKEWSEKCKKRVTWMAQYDELEMYPAQYLFYYEEYRAKGIISDTKNDEVLYNYLIDNDIIGERLCYLEITNILVLKNYKHQTYKLKENIDSMLDYLYWSYGNPYDKDNLLRKHFVKKTMSKYKCNCNEKWEHLCGAYTERGLKYVDDELTMIPALYVIYFNEYKLKGIISQQKNDEVLYKYICKNDFWEDEICYYDLALKLCLKGSDDALINHKSNVRFIVDYLYWSYGLPYDENNYLLQKFELKKQTEIKEKYKVGTSKIRIGQTEYREDLIKYYGKCQICGIENESLLIASHIKDFSKSENQEATDLYNGFLFCDGHDGLFDKGLISFSDEGKAMISGKLSKHDLDIIKPETIKINILDEQRKYLKWHRENKFKK